MRKFVGNNTGGEQKNAPVATAAARIGNVYIHIRVYIYILYSTIIIIYYCTTKTQIAAYYLLLLFWSIYSYFT